MGSRSTDRKPCSAARSVRVTVSRIDHTVLYREPRSTAGPPG
jgi:hypothetical protein